MSTTHQIEATILQQLGGNRFRMMTGAKNFVAGNGTLSFQIGRNSAGVSGVRVTLDVDDTYRMEFLRIRKHVVTILTVKTGVYFDQLQSVFTDQTGMYTSL